MPSPAAERLRKSLEGLDRALIRPATVNPKTLERSLMKVPPNPAIKTNAEIRQLNEQMETLVGVLRNLVDVTLKVDESTTRSNRRMLLLTWAILLVGAASLVLIAFH